MNQFGHMADDLTAMEMLVERMGDRPHTKALKAALQRAFVEACKASRAQRLAEEEQKSSQPRQPKSGADQCEALPQRHPRMRSRDFPLLLAEVGA